MSIMDLAMPQTPSEEYYANSLTTQGQGDMDFLCLYYINESVCVRLSMSRYINIYVHVFVCIVIVMMDKEWNHTNYTYRFPTVDKFVSGLVAFISAS